MNQNQLTGNMPDNWAVGPAFLNLADLQVRAAFCLHCRALQWQQAAAGVQVWQPSPVQKQPFNWAPGWAATAASCCCVRQPAALMRVLWPATAADGVQPLQRHLPSRLCSDQQLLHFCHVVVSALGWFVLQEGSGACSCSERGCPVPQPRCSHGCWGRQMLHVAVGWDTKPPQLTCPCSSFANNQFNGTLPSYINGTQAGLAGWCSAAVVVLWGCKDLKTAARHRGFCLFDEVQPHPSFTAGMITMSVVELHNNRFTGELLLRAAGRLQRAGRGGSQQCAGSAQAPPACRHTCQQP